jgi:hypothetical protein
MRYHAPTMPPPAAAAACRLLYGSRIWRQGIKAYGGPGSADLRSAAAQLQQLPPAACCPLLARPSAPAALVESPELAAAYTPSAEEPGDTQLEHLDFYGDNPMPGRRFPPRSRRPRWSSSLSRCSARCQRPAPRSPLAAPTPAVHRQALAPVAAALHYRNHSYKWLLYGTAPPLLFTVYLPAAGGLHRRRSCNLS